jgi:hypothetical protein
VVEEPVTCRVPIIVEGQASEDRRFIVPGALTAPEELPLYDCNGLEHDYRWLATVRDITLSEGLWAGVAELDEQHVGKAIGATLRIEQTRWRGEGGTEECWIVERGAIIGCCLVDDPAFPVCRIERRSESGE